MFVIPNEIADFLDEIKLPKGTVVVGVSGGADSLYLTFLLHAWCKKNKRNLFAVTVNHNLRPESTQEAQSVHKQLIQHQINHTILTWDGPKPKTHIEERARDKRYELLLNFCHQQKASILFLAHHQQDQTETFWTRLAHSSGLDGLGAMSPHAMREGIMVVRPLLTTSKQQIIQTLKKNKINWVEDPMNDDIAYERVQWRKNQQILDKMGLNSKVITKTTRRLQRAKEALNFYTQQFLNQHLSLSPYGFAQINEQVFTKQPMEIQVRALLNILNTISPKHKKTSLDGVENLLTIMPKYATLSGCQWVISHHQIFIAPELRDIEKAQIQAYRWTTWGNLSLWTNKNFDAQAKAPSPRLKNIPYLIQRTFLSIPKSYKVHVLQQKELEKNVKLDYKDKAPVIILKSKEQKEQP